MKLQNNTSITRPKFNFLSFPLSSMIRLAGNGCSLITSLLILITGCNSPLPPPLTPTPVTTPIVAPPITPAMEIRARAEKIRQRLRYFVEELKTTYQPAKQAALFANVHKEVHPNWQAIKRALEKTPALEQQVAVVKMEKICANIDEALEKADLTLLQAALKEFNSAFTALEQITTP